MTNPTRLLLYLLTSLPLSAVAQQPSADIALLAAHAGTTPAAAVRKPFSLKMLSPMHGMLTVYQRVISPQLATGCLYEQSCSRFSRAAIEAFGPVKGVFVTADRLMRCNRISATTIHPIRWGQQGKVVDVVEYYRRRPQKSIRP